MTSELFDLFVLLVAAVLLVPLFQALRLGAVPGFLVAGVVVGPSGLALIDDVEGIAHIAEIGVVLLLFIIGVELRPARLWQMRGAVFGLGTAQVVATGFALAFLAWKFLGLGAATAGLVGFALALSSTAFVLQILGEQKQLGTEYGRASFGVLLLQDLAVVPLLALVPLLAGGQGGEAAEGGGIGWALVRSTAILAAVVVAGRYLLHPVLHRVARSGNSEVFTASAVLIVLGAALATERAGLSMAMGAFLAGLLISDSAYRHQVIAEIEPFRGLLLGLFFMSMGMMLNLALLAEDPLPPLAMLAILVAVKILVLWPLARLSGLSGRRALATALLLAQGGEFALVAFALARQGGLLPAESFQALLLVVLLSMLVTPLLAKIAYRLATTRGAAAPEALPPEGTQAPVVLAGYGRVGRRIGAVLEQAGQAFVALDNDPDVVARERATGREVYYGDVAQPGLLRAIGVARARVIVVTLNNPEATRRLVATLREQYPEVHILARGHNLETCRSLLDMGANGVVSENVEASLELSNLVLERIGLDDGARAAVVEDFREHYHAQLRRTDRP